MQIAEREYGSIFTKREVVEAILDLIKFSLKSFPVKSSILEPSFGEGSFLFPIIERVLDNYACSGKDDGEILTNLQDVIRAVEIQQDTFERVKLMVIELLKSKGFSLTLSKSLADKWLINDDYLLHNFEGKFDYIVGNPPYIRQEKVSQEKISEYRKQFKTLYDRADIYVAFIEKSLQLLFQNCSRWQKLQDKLKH